MLSSELVDIPEDYLCPITLELMKNPVVAADGHTYEKEAIVRWLESGRRKSPITGQILGHTSLIENYRLRAIIQNFEETKKEQESMNHNTILVEERNKVKQLEQELERMKIAMDKMKKEQVYLNNMKLVYVNQDYEEQKNPESFSRSFYEGNQFESKSSMVENNIKDVDTFCNLGVDLKSQGKVEEAIRVYKSALEINPKHANAFCNLGNALYSQGKMEEAIRAYKSAIEIDPKNADAFYNLRLALKSQGKIEEAIRAYKSAIGNRPKIPWYLLKTHMAI